MFRILIRHDIKEICKEIVGFEKEKELVQKGLLTDDFFKKLCKEGNRDVEEGTEIEIDEDKIKSYLLALDLALEISTDHEQLLFIPSLVFDEKKVQILHIIKT